MKRKMLPILLSIIVSAAALPSASFVASADNKERSGELGTGIVTLYAKDPLAQSLCLEDGSYGKVFHEGQVKNNCSDIVFGSYDAENFSVGVEGGKKGLIVDIGTLDELQRKYGYKETVGRGQGFASIVVREGKVLILKDRQTNSLQELNEGVSLFKEPHTSYTSIPVKAEHVYLMRLVDRHHKTFELIAKILVVAYTPNESVTIRWQVIRAAPAI